MESKIRTLATLAANHFSVQLDAVRLRTGKITERIKINHPEAAAILPFLDSNTILMVRQWRYAIDRETLEIPAGKADTDETLQACAIRELKEETNYRARRMLSLFRYYPAIGYSNELIHIFAGSALEKCTHTPEDDEISQVQVVGLDQIHDLILQGVIQDGKTVIGLALFQAKFERGEIPSDFFS